MLPKLTNYCRHIFWTSALYLIWELPLFAQGSSAVPIDTPGNSINRLSAQDMLVNLSKSIPNLMQLVTAFAYVMGMVFIFQGVMRMKHLGESRTMMSQEHSIKGPLILLTVGALLLYLPTSIQVGVSTFWTNPNPYGYLKEQDQWAQFINICYLIIQFVGTIAFIRGLVIWSHMAGHSTQPGTFSKGLTHIVGGILCINIYQFVKVIMVTFGLQSL